MPQPVNPNRANLKATTCYDPATNTVGTTSDRPEDIKPVVDFAMGKPGSENAPAIANAGACPAGVGNSSFTVFAKLPPGAKFTP